MKTAYTSLSTQSGAVGKILLGIVALVAIGGLYLVLDDDAGKELKKQAELKAIGAIGKAATSRLPDSGDGGKRQLSLDALADRIVDLILTRERRGNAISE